MKPLSKIEPTVGATKPAIFVWQAPESALRISLTLDVVDRLLQDVMRGFGAVPKRGAEVGGFLMGRPADASALLAIEDYELVPIEYRRGPSYLLSPADQQGFDETFSRLQNGARDGLVPLGFFRSHTRDSIGLGPEDREFLDRFFPDPTGIALLIRPYATKVSTAGFYVRGDSGFPDGPPANEFPFRPKDLGGESFVPTPPAADPVALLPLTQRSLSPVVEKAAPVPEPEPEVVTGNRSSWMWLPLSFIFLLLGVLLGYQAAISIRSHSLPVDSSVLSLAVTQDGNNLMVQWNRESSAIQAAKLGILVIDDGSSHRRVELDPKRLQTGNVVYRHGTNQVTFRLEVDLRDRGGVFESVTWNGSK